MSNSTDHPAVPDSIGQRQVVDGAEETLQAGANAEDCYPDPEELTPKQRETMRAIREHPNATQRELADRLDVTSPTISVRVNNIDGFDWENRQAFAEAVLGGPQSTSDGERGVGAATDAADDVDDIVQQLESISETCDRLVSDTSESVDIDPELRHKVTHACMEANYITEDEERRLLEMMINA
ncbi:MarR family transcriptional regulator [Halomicrobium urmianum]|uniref:MarR family transcriptional regulator n=1 Tax=Halomicrobium urmianum TaxID=1586233 RepID=UPI001CD919CB|nr:helix-turn-helix domain-containing protein [Halomicrobium urmianum]